MTNITTIAAGGGPIQPQPAAIAAALPREEDLAGEPAGSIVAMIVNKLVALCGVVPYALVALGLRFVMARAFFLPGQAKIDGPVIPIDLGKYQFSFVLPAQIKDATFQMFETQYASLPMQPTVATYLFTYAEFILPVCLVVGFATRIAAVLLLVMTVLLTVYIMPDALWTLHVYWITMLMVLMSVGPGAVSLDALIRYVYEK
jgi:putative oxidoreductase